MYFISNFKCAAGGKGACLFKVIIKIVYSNNKKGVAKYLYLAT